MRLPGGPALLKYMEVQEMLKELRENCEQQMDANDSCYACPHQDQCAAFQDLRTMFVGFSQADVEPWQLSDHYVERFDELIAKIGGEQ